MQASVDFEQVTAGLSTKSDKIRALSRAGVATADIARFLGIRYQHARNVLMDAGLHHVAGSDADSVGLAEPAAAFRRDESLYAWVDLRPDGSLTIPANMLAAAGIQPGRVHVRQTADGLEFFSREAALARLQAIAAPYKRPGVSEVDEFIAERRREAAREDRGE